MKTHQQITLHFYWTVLIYCVVTNIRQKNYKWKSIQISVSRWQNDWNCRECKTSTASASLETNFWPCSHGRAPSISFVLYVLLGNCDETEISEPMMTRMNRKRKRRRRMATMKMTMKMTMAVVVWQKAALRPINISRTCQWLKTLTFAFASTQLENGEIWPDHWSWLSLMILVIHVLEREKSKPWHIIFISKVCPSYTISKPLCSWRIRRKA